MTQRSSDSLLELLAKVRLDLGLGRAENRLIRLSNTRRSSSPSDWLGIV